MNFYKHYFGDYSRKTAHLSLEQHGAYRKLLDHYYSTRKPLPFEFDKLNRICGAHTQSETESVSFVAEEFFYIGADGLRHNRRCDDEIAKWTHQAEINKAIGKLGGRPKKTESETEPITESVSVQKPNRNPKLEVRSQKLEVRSTEGSKALSPSATPPNGRDYLEEAKAVLQYLNTNSGHFYRPVSVTLNKIVARLKNTTPLQCKEVIYHKVKEWRNDPKFSKYLRPKTLFGETNFEQYLGEIRGGTDGNLPEM